jgi:ethanolamine utilization protein EutQ (cupin superfamily)
MNVPHDPAFAEVNGAITIDRRARATGLRHISAGIAVWSDSTPSEPWLLHYEEVLYNVEGELTIAAGDLKVVGRAGDVVTA